MLFVYCGAFGENSKKIRANIVKSLEVGKTRRKHLRAIAKGSIYHKKNFNRLCLVSCFGAFESIPNKTEQII